MDEIQEKHEKAVGLNFIAWYNDCHQTAYRYVGRADEAPDLIFCADDELRIEVTDAYYDAADAELKWKIARDVSDFNEWRGVNFDATLANNISSRIEIKSLNKYGGKCFLLINVNPPITLASELAALIPTISIPAHHSFAGIYLLGRFPSSANEEGGFSCWKLA